MFRRKQRRTKDNKTANIEQLSGERNEWTHETHSYWIMGVSQVLFNLPRQTNVQEQRPQNVYVCNLSSFELALSLSLLIPFLLLCGGLFFLGNC